MSSPTQRPSPRIAVVQQDDVAPLGLLAPPLADADLTLVRPDAGDVLPSADAFDGVVVLGGRASAYDTEAAPWTDDVTGYLRACVDADVPVLAVCLGAQQLAVATGGAVEVGHPAGPERGVVEIRFRPDAETDPVLGGAMARLGRDVPVVESHADAVSVLPDGATWLASSRQYPFQAFRLGSAWGVQFHPEADAQTLAGWEAEHGGDADEARRRYDADGDRLHELADAVASGFLDLVRERTGAPVA